MDQKKILKQMFELNQASFNNSFQMVAMLQDQIQRFTRSAINQAEWLPADGRKVIENWVEAYRTGRDNFKEQVDEGYRKVEKYFSD